MKIILPTKARMQKRIREITTWVAAALIGGGLALTFSVIFLGPGIVLLGLGIVVAVLGIGAGVLATYGLPYLRLRCTHCAATSEVLATSKAFHCDRCSRMLLAHDAILVPRATPVEPKPYLLARKMLLAFSAMSYVAFFIEVYLGHNARWMMLSKEGILGPALVPIFFSPVALVIALWAVLRFTPRSVTVFNLTMMGSILVGLVGTYFHLSTRMDNLSAITSLSTWLGDPPALAPFAFALPGIMGLVATFGVEWSRVEEEEAREAPAPRPSRAASESH